MKQPLIPLRSRPRTVWWRCALLGNLLFVASLVLAQGAAQGAAPEAVQEAATAQTDAEPADKPAAPVKKELPSLDELLQRTEADPNTYTVRCISSRRIRSHQVLDSKHLLFKLSNDELYLVQFPRRCFGLRKGDPISYTSNSGRLCKLDAIRPVENFGRGLETGIPCYIPEFQKVTPEQIEYLKEALQAEREARRRR